MDKRQQRRSMLNRGQHVGCILGSDSSSAPLLLTRRSALGGEATLTEAALSFLEPSLRNGGRVQGEGFWCCSYSIYERALTQ